jgi:hypothetical protein
MRSFGISEVAIAVLILIWVVFRQVQARPLATGRMMVLPGALAVLGLLALGRAAGSGHGLASAAVPWLAADLGLAVVSGAARAPSVRVFERDGRLWRRGGALTVVLWLVSIGARAGLEALAARAGAGTALDDVLPLTFGVSLVAQYVVIALRARGVALLPAARAKFPGRRTGRHPHRGLRWPGSPEPPDVCRIGTERGHG